MLAPDSAPFMGVCTSTWDGHVHRVARQPQTVDNKYVRTGVCERQLGRAGEFRLNVLRRRRHSFVQNGRHCVTETQESEISAVAVMLQTTASREVPMHFLLESTHIRLWK